MAFYVVEVDNDGFKVYDSAGNLIDPAKDASVTALGTILTALKDTDGIKKIVDALPTGTNEIGKVAQGTKAAGSAAWPIVLYDAGGNAISILSDSGVYRVQTVSKLLNAAGTQINPATEDTLALIKTTDGIKKIVDALPTGTNEIGKVAQGTKAAGSAAWPIVLYDAGGNAISILSDSGVYRVQTVGKLLNASGAQINPATEDTLALIKTTDGIKKIVDPLPAGTNTIGKVDQGAAGASAWLVTGSGGGGSTQVEGRAADGATAVGNPVLIGGVDGTTVQIVATDAQGRIIVSPQGVTSSLRGFSDGKVVLAATALAPVRWTPYTEQTSNAQRSIASSSANDTAAGTGARTAQITYYSVTAGVVTGPFYEIVILNGTSYVNTISTTIAFIEKIKVLTVGSGLTNAGILTLKAATAGGGATIVTIGVGEGQTFLGLHYATSGRTMKLTSVSIGIKGADAAGYLVKALDLSSAGKFERQVSDLIRIGTNQSTVIRSYGTPIEIIGPARVQIYVLPDSTSSRTYYAAMDYFEE